MENIKEWIGSMDRHGWIIGSLGKEPNRFFETALY